MSRTRSDPISTCRCYARMTLAAARRREAAHGLVGRGRGVVAHEVLYGSVPRS
jgi:hypothetical protein